MEPTSQIGDDQGARGKCIGLHMRKVRPHLGAQIYQDAHDMPPLQEPLLEYSQSQRNQEEASLTHEPERG